MNCVSHQPDETASAPGQVVVLLIAKETELLPDPAENPVVSKLAVQAAMNHRAEAITNVLAGIMEQPAAYRHWGLNE